MSCLPFDNHHVFIHMTSTIDVIEQVLRMKLGIKSHSLLYKSSVLVKYSTYIILYTFGTLLQSKTASFGLVTHHLCLY